MTMIMVPWMPLYVPRSGLLCICHLRPIWRNACQLFWVGRPGRSYWHFQLLDIFFGGSMRFVLYTGCGCRTDDLATWLPCCLPGSRFLGHRIISRLLICPCHCPTGSQVSLLTPHCWQGTSSICWGDLLPGWVTIPSCKHANIKSTVGISWSQVYQTLIQLRFFHFHFSSKTLTYVL